MTSFEYPVHQYQELARDPFDAAQDASAFRDNGMEFLCGAGDIALGAILLTCFAHTSPDTGRIGYSVSYGSRMPHGHDHLEAMLGVLTDLSVKLPYRSRLKMALAVLRGGEHQQLVLTDQRQGRPDANTETDPDA